MKSTVMAGIVLIVLGVLALAYQGISYTRDKKVVDLGPIQATAKTHERIPLPPIVGAIALAGGLGLVIVGARQN